MYKLTTDDLAAMLADRVWERFDLDVEEMVENTNLATIVHATEHDIEAYNSLLVEFASHLLTSDALQQAAALAKAREDKDDHSNPTG